jgi:signal transduction histidine kinase
MMSGMTNLGSVLRIGPIFLLLWAAALLMVAAPAGWMAPAAALGLAALVCYLGGEIADPVERSVTQGVAMAGAVFVAWPMARVVWPQVDFLQMNTSLVFALMSTTPFSMLRRWRAQSFHKRVQNAARQEERQRLARDLHDSVKQQIFAIQASLATAQQRWESDLAGSRAAVEQARQATRDASREMQTLLDQLQAEPLEINGLVAALRQQGEVLALRTGAEVRVDIGKLPAPGTMAAEAIEGLNRVAQEALANVGRHARASKVEVTLLLQEKAGELRLKVRDNGAGFASEAPAGMGLGNIRTRASELGGSARVTSAQGAGTVVEVKIPLVKPAGGRTLGQLRFAAIMQLLATTISAAALLPLVDWSKPWVLARDLFFPGLMVYLTVTAFFDLVLAKRSGLR